MKYFLSIYLILLLFFSVYIMYLRLYWFSAFVLGLSFFGYIILVGHNLRNKKL
jgi:hypothetical protein